MVISEIGIRGFKSFGNNEQVLKLNTEVGELILLSGSNGNGKSLIPSTEIEVDIPINEFELEDFITLLEVMDEGRGIIEYIKENNPLLYDQYIEYINKQKEAR